MLSKKELVVKTRMFLSENSLKSVKIIDNEEFVNKISESDLNIDNITVLDSIESSDELKSSLSDKGENSYNIILVKNYAVLISACCASYADKLLFALTSYVNGDKFELPKANPLNHKNHLISNKVAIVTGGAQGFGGGIVKQLFEDGANVVIADLNEEKGREYANELNCSETANRVKFVKANVSEPDSISNLIYQTIAEFGGLDLFVSNAGILRAGGLDEMTPETFDLMTKVNYSAYFYCSKYASEVMKMQSSVNSNFYMDIIQINSKSGLKGSNKNFAYAGGKFGGVGLTQSFALELMPYNIKVNSVCPGNFFEGPLWSDSEKGLFVQYLNAGKVPGAKTIEDVKRFYESQVPAGRGCRPGDVMKAIYYIVDQQYETGQAVPVTGGQNMLK